MSQVHNEIASALTGHHAAKPGVKFAPPTALLATARDGARILNVSLRTFHALRPKLPAPIVLGLRSVRWRIADLTTFVEGQPAAQPTPEPEQLRIGKAARRGTAVSLLAERTCSDAQIQAGRGVGLPAVPSNPNSAVGATA